MIDSQEGKEKLGCDGMCYGCCHDLPKGHPDRQEPCPVFEICPYNPLIKQEAFAEIFCWIIFLGIPVIVILWIGSIIISFIKS